MTTTAYTEYQGPMRTKRSSWAHREGTACPDVFAMFEYQELWFKLRSLEHQALTLIQGLYASKKLESGHFLSYTSNLSLHFSQHRNESNEACIHIVSVGIVVLWLDSRVGCLRTRLESSLAIAWGLQLVRTLAPCRQCHCGRTAMPW